MSSKFLTSDNPLLSRPKICRAVLGSEVNFKLELPPGVATYVENSLSENTRRAYASDLDHFQQWGGVIPAQDVTLAQYLVEHAETLSVATLVRRLATIAKAHSAKGFPNPTRSELVKATIRGIKRKRGSVKAEAKPLLRDDLFILLERTADDVRGVRDRALLLIGFAGGFRRSELVGLDVEDVECGKPGIVITLRKSKTDQTGLGRKIAIPFGRGCWCPIRALDRWLERANITSGPLFRCVTKHEQIVDRRLSGEAVSLIVKGRLSDAGISSAGYSAHSLRAGFATSAAMAGASTWKIRQQTGHASDAMLSRYIRDGELFVNNAAGILF